MKKFILILCTVLIFTLLLSACSVDLPFGIRIGTGDDSPSETQEETSAAATTGDKRELPPVQPLSPESVTEEPPMDLSQFTLPEGTAPAAQETPVAQEAPAAEQTPATPDFERLGINAGMAVGSSYAYRTATFDNAAVATFGTVSVRSYAKEPVADYLARSNTMQALASALGSIAGAHDLSGYEARTLVMRIDCQDEGADQYGVRYNTRVTDYYDIGLAERTMTEESGGYTWQIRSGGTEVPAWFVSADVTVEEGHTYDRVFLFIVPANYDGAVCGAMDRGKVNGTETLTNGDTNGAYYFFRLN